MTSTRLVRLLTPLGKLLFSLALLLFTPVLCMCSSFLLFLPKDHITIKDVVLIFAHWLPLVSNFLVSGIPSMLGLGRRSFSEQFAITSIICLSLIGTIYWIMQKSLSAKTANAVWIAVTLTLFILETAATWLFVILAVASSGL